MAKRIVFTCNVCGKDKQTTNHWWLAYISNGVGLMISAWRESLAENEQVQTLCGQECVTKALAKWMEKQSMAAHAE